jgi:lipopolysaccharide transport system permease protein
MRGEYLKDLLFVLLQKELMVRYKGSWLGYVWSLAHPLAFAFIYYIAFGIMMQVQIPDYPLFLISALFPWQWLANSLNASPSVFLANASLLKRVHFPRHALVAAVVLNDGVHFILSLPAITAFLLLYGRAPSWSWVIGVPWLALTQFMLVYGAALAIASLNLFFRDLDRLTALLVTLLLFLTPVVYAESMIPAEYRALIYLNPVAPLTVSWRNLLLSGRLETFTAGLASLYALLAMALGFFIYQRLSWRFAEVV